MKIYIVKKHERVNMLRSLSKTFPAAASAARISSQPSVRSMATVEAAKLFDYETITKNLKPSKKGVEAIEHCFGMLAKGHVDVPIPMHIGIPESPVSKFSWSSIDYIDGLIDSYPHFLSIPFEIAAELY